MHKPNSKVLWMFALFFFIGLGSVFSCEPAPAQNCQENCFEGIDSSDVDSKRRTSEPSPDSKMLEKHRVGEKETIDIVTPEKAGVDKKVNPELANLEPSTFDKNVMEQQTVSELAIVENEVVLPDLPLIEKIVEMVPDKNKAPTTISIATKLVNAQEKRLLQINESHLALASDGTAHVVYYKRGKTEGQLKYLTNPACSSKMTENNILSIKDIANRFVYEAAITLDRNQNPHILFDDTTVKSTSTKTHKFYWARKGAGIGSGTSKYLYKTDESTGRNRVPTQLQIQIDSKGNLHQLGYVNNGGTIEKPNGDPCGVGAFWHNYAHMFLSPTMANSHKDFCANYEHLPRDKTHNPALVEHRYGGADFTLDTKDTAHFVHNQKNNFRTSPRHARLAYSWRIGTKWAFSEVRLYPASPSEPGARAPGIAIDKNGHPHIIYYDNDTQSSAGAYYVYHVKGTPDGKGGFTWKKQGSPVVTFAKRMSLFLAATPAFDGKGNLHYAYLTTDGVTSMVRNAQTGKWTVDKQIPSQRLVGFAVLPDGRKAFLLLTTKTGELILDKHNLCKSN